MCRIARLFLLHRLKGSMSGDARFQQHRDVNCHFFLQDKAPKEIHDTLTETLREHAPSHGNVKTGWISLNNLIFPTVLCLDLDDTKHGQLRRLLKNSRANLGKPSDFGTVNNWITEHLTKGLYEQNFVKRSKWKFVMDSGNKYLCSEKRALLAGFVNKKQLFFHSSLLMI
jgi:hypothetical protein